MPPPSRLLGVKEFVSTLRRIAAKFPDKVAAAIYYEAQIEMTEAKRRCPVSPHGGDLRASGFVHEPERGRGRTISVTLSFGGAAMPYALAVHEHLSEHSPLSWRIAENVGTGVRWTVPGTGPKFLESVLNESRESMPGRIAARVHLSKEK